MKKSKHLNNLISEAPATAVFRSAGGIGQPASWLLVAAVACAAVSCGGDRGGGAAAMQAPRATVDVVTVTPRSYRITEKFPGTLAANTIVQLRPDVTGYLEAIRVPDGSLVRKGQPLYAIDKSRYQAAYNQTTAAVRQAEADLSQKQRDLKRYQDLQSHDAIARQVVDQASTAVATAQANVAAQQAAVSKASTDLSHAVLKAPVSGKLGMVQVKIGDIINAGQTLINTIVNDKPMYMDFDVPQARIGEFTGAGKNREFHLQLSGSTVYGESGKLVTLNNVVDPNSGTIRVRVAFPNSDGQLTSGMSAVALVTRRSDSGALAVPTKALIQTLAETSLYTLGDGNVVTVVSVAPTGQLDSLTLVKGLSPGARVVVDGLQSIRPGDTVNVRTRNVQNP